MWSQHLGLDKILPKGMETSRFSYVCFRYLSDVVVDDAFGVVDLGGIGRVEGLGRKLPDDVGRCDGGGFLCKGEEIRYCLG